MTCLYWVLEGQNRRMYEVTVRSKFDGAANDVTRRLQVPEVTRREFGACLVSGPKGPPGCDRTPVPGSVLLLEADKRYPSGAAAEAWSSCFSLVRQIPGSVPPRVNLPIDTCRNVITCAAMVLLITNGDIGLCEHCLWWPRITAFLRAHPGPDCGTAS